MSQPTSLFNRFNTSGRSFVRPMSRFTPSSSGSSAPQAVVPQIRFDVKQPVLPSLTREELLAGDFQPLISKYRNDAYAAIEEQFLPYQTQFQEQAAGAGMVGSPAYEGLNNQALVPYNRARSEVDSYADVLEQSLAAGQEEARAMKAAEEAQAAQFQAYQDAMMAQQQAAMHAAQRAAEQMMEQQREFMEQQDQLQRAAWDNMNQQRAAQGLPPIPYPGS